MGSYEDRKNWSEIIASILYCFIPSISQSSRMLAYAIAVVDALNLHKTRTKRWSKISSVTYTIINGFFVSSNAIAIVNSKQINYTAIALRQNQQACIASMYQRNACGQQSLIHRAFIIERKRNMMSNPFYEDDTTLDAKMISRCSSHNTRL